MTFNPRFHLDSEQDHHLQGDEPNPPVPLINTRGQAIVAGIISAAAVLLFCLAAFGG